MKRFALRIHWLKICRSIARPKRLKYLILLPLPLSWILMISTASITWNSLSVFFKKTIHAKRWIKKAIFLGVLYLNFKGIWGGKTQISRKKSTYSPSPSTATHTTHKIAIYGCWNQLDSTEEEASKFLIH